MLEDIDKTQIGRYGTISLLKRQDPPTVITSFGIDAQELTFGRDPDCGVRLYYPDIDQIHCKIIFEERKAFLVVLGRHGLLVDGCLVYPNSGVHGTQTVVPLTNNSEIEIHSKRFRFTYPPKELRAMLFASPIRHNRALRLSMIHSAQVFSPQPVCRPEENLRVLQTPLKSTFLRSPIRPSTRGPSDYQNGGVSPTKSFNDAPGPDLMEVEEECDDIVLVEGDHPHVVEEETDLVILEDVETPPPAPRVPVTPPSLNAEHPMHLHMMDPPQTPRRRPSSRDSLHRAVLIRSAQRAMLRGDREDDEVEEMEVISVVASDDDLDLDTYEHENERDKTTWEGVGANDEIEESVDGHHVSTWEDLEDVRSPRELSTPTGKSKNGLSTSVDFSEIYRRDQTFSTPHEHGKGSVGLDPEEAEEIRHLENPTSTIRFEPTQRHLSDFMTPQPPARRKFQRRNLLGLQKSENEQNMLQNPESLGEDQIGEVRYSISGGEPRRMLVEMPWRVKDLVVPLRAERSHSTSFSDAVGPNTLPSESNPHTLQSATLRSARKLVDEQERKAIQERRRSALRGANTFFVGGVPGMGVSPTKNSVVHQRTIYPSNTPKATSVSLKQEEETTPLGSPQISVPAGADKEEEDEELDTRSLLERMKVTVEEMKRRRSTMFAPLSSSCLGSSESTTKIHYSPIAAMDLEGDQVHESGTEELTEDCGKVEILSLLADPEHGGISPIVSMQCGFVPEVVVNAAQEEQEECAMEKSFSQLMRSESPQDTEHRSDEICDILEQDIVIPSRRTRSPSRTTSAEPSTRPLAHKRGTIMEHPIAVSGDALPRSSRGVQMEQNTPVESRGQRPPRRGEKGKSGTLETSNQSTDQPATRATRTGRRGRTAVSTANLTRKPEKEKVYESEEEGCPSTFNSQSIAKASKTRDPGSLPRGRPRKAKEEGHETPALKTARNTRKRSATESRILGTAKTPVTRSSGRRTPATAPSAVLATDAQDERQDVDKENSQSVKTMPEEGSKIRITRNRATHSSTAATTSKIANRVKPEEVESDPPGRATRSRAKRT